MITVEEFKNEVYAAPSTLRSSLSSRIVGSVSLVFGILAALTGIGFFFGIISIVDEPDYTKYALASSFLVIAVLLLMIRYLTHKVRERNRFIEKIQKQAGNIAEGN